MDTFWFWFGLVASCSCCYKVDLSITCELVDAHGCIGNLISIILELKCSYVDTSFDMTGWVIYRIGVVIYS
jgi:hypothetical protein